MKTAVSLHRFRDQGAVATLGTGGETLYLDAAQMRELARQTTRLARDLERRTFTESDYRGVEIPARLAT